MKSGLFVFPFFTNTNGIDIILYFDSTAVGE